MQIIPVLSGCESAQSSAQCPGTGDVDGLDSHSPFVVLSQPSAGSTVSGTVTVRANATDDREVARVDFYVNGEVAFTDTTVPYSFAWDTSVLAPTSYELQAKAYDAANNERVSSKVKVSVGTGPMRSTYPLAISANRHYLTTQNGSPFLYVADTCWTLLSRLSLADAKKIIDMRKSQGFNAIQTNLLGWNRNEGGLRGTPFENGDLTVPRSAYFAGVDEIVNYAESQNMVLLVGTMWLADNGGRAGGNAPSVSAMQTYAAFLAQRFASHKNVFWFIGGDDDPNTQQSLLREHGKALYAADPGRLITFHTWNEIYGVAGETWMGFNSIQWNNNGAPYDYVHARKGYEHGSSKPFLNIEPAYDPAAATGETNTTLDRLRRNTWWSLLGGAFGVVYGGPSGAWNVGEGEYNAGNFERPGAVQVGLVSAILAPYPWHLLVPDWNHNTLTGGYGTYNNSDYATAGMAPDGSLLVAYTPGSRSLVINMSKFSGTVDAFWVDPTSANQRSAGSALANNGSKTFSTPGPNAGGQNDWILILSKK